MLGIWADFTHLPDRKTLQHFITSKAREEQIITLGRWQRKARKVDYHSHERRQLVDGNAPLQQVTALLIWKCQKMRVGRTRLDVSRPASGLPESFISSQEAGQPTGNPVSLPSLTTQIRVLAPCVSEFLASALDDLGRDVGSCGRPGSGTCCQSVELSTEHPTPFTEATGLRDLCGNSHKNPLLMSLKLGSVGS